MRKLLAAIDILVDRPSRIAPGRRSYTDNYTPGADRIRDYGSRPVRAHRALLHLVDTPVGAACIRDDDSWPVRARGALLRDRELMYI